MSSYSGRVNYLGQYSGEGGSYSIFCCGSCWLEYIESSSFQTRLLERENRIMMALQEDEARRKEAKMESEDGYNSDNMEAEI